MPNQSLIISTNSQDELSGHVPQMNFGKLWNQPNSTSTAGTPYLAPSPTVSAFDWNLFTSGTSGFADIHTKITYAGVLPNTVVDAISYYAYALSVLYRLNEKSLVEACESLTDIYTWQIKPVDSESLESPPRLLSDSPTKKLSKLAVIHRE